MPDQDTIHDFIAIFIALMAVILLMGLVGGWNIIVTDFSNKAAKDALVYYYLPETLLKITSIVKVMIKYSKTDNSPLSASVIQQTFTVTTEQIADTDHLLAIQFRPSPLMADSVKYRVNTKGLLEISDTISDDRTMAVFATLAEGTKNLTVNEVVKATEKEEDFYTVTKDYSADFSIKASDASGEKVLINWQLPVTGDTPNEKGVIWVDCSFHINNPDVPVNKPLAELLGYDRPVNGILTRPLKNVSLSLTPAAEMLQPSLPLNVAVADTGKVIVVPVKRTPFARRVNKLVVQDGMILSNEIENGSSFEGYMSIPVNAAKAMVSIIGQVFQFKINIAKKSNELEKEKLALDKTLLETQKFAQSRQAEMEKNQVLIDHELKKQHLDYEKALLGSDKERLEMWKMLEELKKKLKEAGENPPISLAEAKIIEEAAKPILERLNSQENITHCLLVYEKNKPFINVYTNKDFNPGALIPKQVPYTGLGNEAKEIEVKVFGESAPALNKTIAPCAKIGNLDGYPNNFGSNGGVLYDSVTGEPYFVTCYHVVKSPKHSWEFQANNNEWIVFGDTNEVWGQLIKASRKGALDVALIKPLEGFKVHKSINGIGIPYFTRAVGLDDKLYHTEVKMYGMVSGLSYGYIIDYNQSIDFPYIKDGSPNKAAWQTVEKVIVVKAYFSGTTFSQPGDSGSFVIDQYNYLIGILLGRDKDISFVIPITAITSELNIDVIAPHSA